MLINIDTRNRLTKEAAGGVMFGPDASTWPAWWCDAVAVMQVQSSMQQEAERKAIGS